MSTKQINKAFAVLEQAAADFQNAIYKFQKVYDPGTVGLNEWAESIDEVLFDIDQDLQAFEESLED